MAFRFPRDALIRERCLFRFLHEIAYEKSCPCRGRAKTVAPKTTNGAPARRCGQVSHNAGSERFHRTQACGTARTRCYAGAEPPTKRSDGNPDACSPRRFTSTGDKSSGPLREYQCTGQGSSSMTGRRCLRHTTAPELSRGARRTRNSAGPFSGLSGPLAIKPAPRLLLPLASPAFLRALRAAAGAKQRSRLKDHGIVRGPTSTPWPLWFAKRCLGLSNSLYATQDQPPRRHIPLCGRPRLNPY